MAAFPSASSILNLMSDQGQYWLMKDDSLNYQIHLHLIVNPRSKQISKRTDVECQFPSELFLQT